MMDLAQNMGAQCLAHRDVAPCVGVGLPDALRAECVEVDVVLGNGAIAERMGLQAVVQERLSTYSHPIKLSVSSALPVTVIGKAMGKELRAPREGRSIMTPPASCDMCEKDGLTQ